MAILRPSQDIITGGWASTDASLTAAIDEVTYSDADYISTTTAGDKARVSLGTYTTSAGTHALKYRAASPEADLGLIVRVLELGQPPAIVTSKQPWRQQPQVPVRIDWNNPLGKRVRYASTLGVSLFDSFSVKFAVNNNNSLPVISPKGIARNFVTANSQYLALPTNNIVSGYPLTVACFINPAFVSTNSGIAYSFNGTNYNAIIGAGYIADRWMINISSSPGPIGTVAVAGLQHMVVVHRSGSFDMYKDGQRLNQVGVANNWSQPVAGNHSIGNRLNGASPQYFSGGIQDLIIFEGELSLSEAKSLYDNHWQIFKPQKRISYFDAPKILATQTKTYTELGTTPADQTLTLSAGEVASITNGAELALEVEST